MHTDISYPARLTTWPGDQSMRDPGKSWLDSCINKLVPENVTRAKFHVSRGQAILDLYNGTIGNPLNQSIRTDIYLPHLRYASDEGDTAYNTGKLGKLKSKQSMWIYKHWYALYTHHL